MKTIAAVTLVFMLVTAGLALDFSVNTPNSTLGLSVPTQVNSIY
ncbi:hypothetical protein [Maritalea sp.]